MKFKSQIPLLFVVLLFTSFNFLSCNKSDSTPPPSTDPCDGKTITITATPTDAEACDDNGTITVTASGSTGFNYKLNSTGTYQTGNSFDKLAAGTYTVFVKDGSGCEKSSSVTVSSTGTAGSLFTAAKTLIASKCQSCHNNTNSQGSMNWQVECNIVKFQSNIKDRAVDKGTMPPTGPLTQSEKDIITNWISAGGKYTD